MTGDNRRRALNEIVSLEAWHDPFSKSDKKVDLHVDVAFLTGRLGGEDESPVRFVLSLRQAEIVVIIPPSEPARIDPKSVSRDGPQLSAKLTEERTVKKSGKAKAKAKAGLDQKGLTGGIAIGVEGETSAVAKTHLQVTQAVKNMRLMHRLDADGHHGWLVSAIGKEEVLAGRPWNAAEDPRFKVVDTRADRTKGLPPGVKVEVRCRREDLKIDKIELKDPKGLADQLKRGSKRNKQIAAEAIIRTRLHEEGLLDGDSTDRFAVMTLAWAMAESD